MRARMAACIDGQHQSATEPMAVAALSAAAARCASTTAWLPRLHRLQLSGTMRRMLPWAFLTLWWHIPISQLADIARSAATDGLPRLMLVSASSLAAQSVPPEGQSPSIQPLQSVSTRRCKSGTTSAMVPVATILTTQS